MFHLKIVFEQYQIVCIRIACKRKKRYKFHTDSYQVLSKLHALFQREFSELHAVSHRGMSELYTVSLRDLSEWYVWTNYVLIQVQMFMLKINSLFILC